MASTVSTVLLRQFPPVNVLYPVNKHNSHVIKHGAALQAFQLDCTEGRITDDQPEFYNVSHSKQDYEEYGPSLVRRFSVFGSAV